MRLRDFIKRLFKSENTFDSKLKSHLKTTSNRLKKQARLNATIDPKRRTGNLYNTISAPMKKSSYGFFVALQAGSSTVNYAPFVELGTSRMYPRLFLERARQKEEKKLPAELKKFVTIFTKTI